MAQLKELPKEFDALRNTLLKSSVQASVRQALALAKKIDALICSDPYKILGLSYANLQKTSLPETELAVYKVMVFVHLCRINRLNSTSLNLLCSSLILTVVATSIEPVQRKLILQKIQRGFVVLNYELASSLLRIAKIIHLNDPLRYLSKLKLTSWQWLAVSASVLTSYTGKRTFNDTLSKLLTNIPQWMRQHVTPLLSYPSLYPPGTQVNYHEQRAVVLSSQRGKLLIACNNSLITLAPTECRALNTPIEHNIEPLFDLLDKTRFFDPIFKIDKPPRSLLAVIHQTQADKLDIGALVESIECEPRFSAFIRDSAQTSNRLQLNVNTVKQAVMTYGSERLGDMLTTHALLDRLTQNNFPLKQQFIEHVSLCSALASELAKKTQIMLPQSASLLVLVCHSWLFTAPSLKIKTQWTLDKSNVGLGFNGLIESITVDSMRISSVRLAKSWQLSPNLLKLTGQLLREKPDTTKKPNTLICLALLWARQIKIGNLNYYVSGSSLEIKLLNKISLAENDKCACLEVVSQQLLCLLHH